MGKYENSILTVDSPESEYSNSDIGIGECVYCHATNVPVTSIPETDVLCIDCMRLTRDNCNSAIKALSNFKNKGDKKKSNKTLEELKEDAEKALFKLTGQQIKLD